MAGRAAWNKRVRSWRGQIVLTGAPVSAKSECLGILEKAFPGKIRVVPEIAMMLIDGGVPHPATLPAKASMEAVGGFQKMICDLQVMAEDYAQPQAAVVETAHQVLLEALGKIRRLNVEDMSEQQVTKFQEMIANLQHMTENYIQSVAFHSEGIATAVDRGLLDGAAYLSGGQEQFVREMGPRIGFGMTREQMFDRYGCVIHLETVALTSKELYAELNRKSKYPRPETAARAIDLDKRLKEAWHGHPNVVLVKSSLQIDEKISKVLSIVREHCKFD